LISVAQNRSDDSKAKWFAVQVWARKESFVAAHLQGLGYECFLPTYRSQRKWSDRTKELEQPLFPGYLFSRFDFENRRPVVMTRGVQCIVGVKGIPTPVDEHEIAAIQALVASGVPNQPCPYLEIGEEVCIESGPLRGLRGILMDFKGSHRLALSVTLLRRSVAVVIDCFSVASLNAVQSTSAAHEFEYAQV
jgi:transcription antitermination factor NusG